jgi:hypothetical protein
MLRGRTRLGEQADSSDIPKFSKNTPLPYLPGAGSGLNAPETEQTGVGAIFTEPERKILTPSLGFLNVQSAFAMKVRSGALDSKSAGPQRCRFMLDIAAGDIEVYNITEWTCPLTGC